MAPTLRIVGEDVLFAHWPVDVTTLEAVVPDPLTIDTFEGSGWITFLTHKVREVGVEASPSLPLQFGEVDLRTYVRHEEESGVLFLSCNTSQRLNASVGERVFQLPYTHASISINHNDVETILRGRQLGPNSDGRYDVKYRPTGRAKTVEPDSLAEFLLERHTYFTPEEDSETSRMKNKLTVGRVERDPWEISPVDATIRTNTLFDSLGFEAPQSDPVFHYSPRFESRFVDRQPVSL